MRHHTSNLRKITIHALWSGFATPPTTSNRLMISRDSDGQFIATDEITENMSVVEEQLIQEFLESLSLRCEKPDASLLGCTDEEAEWHFGGCSTDDYPHLRVEICFDNLQIVLETDSNHAQLLPWKVDALDESVSYHPNISRSIAKMMPDGFLFRERLISGVQVWEAEADMRREIRKQEEVRKDEPEEELSFEENKARIDGLLNDLFSNMLDGEQVSFEGSKVQYSANQLLCFSLDELKQLSDEGFDLSTSDETGQTALMLSAFPPFNAEQFDKLVTAGADVNAKRTDGMSGLMLAAAGHMEDSVRHWLAAGAEVNIRGPENCTALMLGARCGPIVAALLDAGADTTLVDDDGDSAIEYVMENLSVMRAQSRLNALTLIVERLAKQDPSLVQRGLANARKLTQKTCVEMSVLESLGRQPMSENLRQAQLRANEDKANARYIDDMNEFIDLEITEIELANRIVAILEASMEPLVG